jgi:hypothetical protein
MPVSKSRRKTSDAAVKAGRAWLSRHRLTRCFAWSVSSRVFIVVCAAEQLAAAVPGFIPDKTKPQVPVIFHSSAGADQAHVWQHFGTAFMPEKLRILVETEIGRYEQTRPRAQTTDTSTA